MKKTDQMRLESCWVRGMQYTWGCLLLCLFCAVQVEKTFAQAGSSRLSESERLVAERFFEQHIRPVLVTECIQCHGEKKQKGELRLDSYEALLKGGESGPALVPGKPDESLIVEAVRYESFEMPPAHPLKQSEVEAIVQWVASGAIWPQTVAALNAAESRPTDDDRDWWAFRPYSLTSPPDVENESWANNPIDQFVLSRMKEVGVNPAPRADKATLLRRLYFDLLGVPPSPDEMQSFLEDESPSAWESRVEALLEDSRYGEHWARYWLDLVRYSESDGWNKDDYRPLIWRYRDYVIRSFNDDKSYPQFVREQLAGDELDSDDPDRLIATGFLRLGIYEYNQRDARGQWNDIMNEMTDVAGDVFLGLSMACARCHDHKFDPIPQSDYFQLRAFFEPVIWRDDLVAATAQEKLEYEQQLEKWEAATMDVRAKIDSLIEPYYKKKWLSTVDKFPLDIQACFHMPVEERTSWQHQMAYLVSRQFMEEAGGPLKDITKEDKAQHEALKKELAAFDALKPKDLPSVMAAADFGGMISPTRIQDARSSVKPAHLSVLGLTGVASPNDIKAGTTGRRTELAAWIGDPQNVLTTRVIVNRIWQYHFGEGIVATPNDFGFQGEEPSHPELLDWMCRQFTAGGSRFKQLHKLILTSETWMQSATHPDAEKNEALDPHEQLLWRSRVRRLRAEQIRDAMLATAGNLNAKVGGPSVKESEPRRALYVKSYRNKYDTFMHGFDVANGLKSVSVRDATTTPTQALLLFNGDYAMQQAKILAQRIAKEFADPEAQIAHAFQLVWNRPATAQEVLDAKAFLGDEPSEDAFADFCHVLFNSNQFLYLH